MGARWLLLVVAASCSHVRGEIAAATVSNPAPIQIDGKGLGIVSFGASVSSVTKALTAALGAPTGHPSAGCSGEYVQAAWHDLIVQFRNGRFEGYRYLAGGLNGVSPTTKTLHLPVRPRLETATGVTLGDTFARVRRAYSSLRQSGTDFWRTSDGIIFAFDAHGIVEATSIVYEIKNDVCPGAL